MKIVCPDCKKEAILADNFSKVECRNCGLEKTYGEYIRYISEKDPRYSDILNDYTDKKY